VSLSPEPTLIQISSIRGPDSTIEPTPALMKLPQSEQKMRQSPPRDWKQSRPAMKHCTRIWSKPWPELSKTYKGTRSSLNKSQDHLGLSKQFRHWKQPSPCSIETTRSPNTKFQNMPPETDAGNVHPVFTRCPSRTYLNMTSKPITTRTGSLATKWHRSSSKIPNWLMKFLRLTKHRQKSSKRILSWPWSPKQWPLICLSSTITEVKETPERKISPHGEHPFSKERSDDSENNYKNETGDSESESEIKSKNIKRESDYRDKKTMMTDSKAKEVMRLKHSVTVRADEVRAIKRTKTTIKMIPEKQLYKIKKNLALTKTKLRSSFHLHLATEFYISILMFNYFLVYHFDYPFLTFNCKDFRACEKHRSLQTRAWHWAEILATQLAIPESTKSPRNSENRLDLLTKDLHRNILVPATLQSKGLLWNSENNTQIDSFIFSYLDTTR
jgi:hypothetical protein